MEYVPPVSFSTKKNILEFSPTVEMMPDEGTVKACLLVDKNQKIDDELNQTMKSAEVTQIDDEKSVTEFVKEYIKSQIGVKKPQNVITDTGVSYEEMVKEHAASILAMTRSYVEPDSNYSGFYVLTKLVKNDNNRFEIQSEFTSPRKGLENILENLEQVRIMKKERVQHRENVENSLLLIFPASAKKIKDI